MVQVLDTVKRNKGIFYLKHLMFDHFHSLHYSEHYLQQPDIPTLGYTTVERMNYFICIVKQCSSIILEAKPLGQCWEVLPWERQSAILQSEL